MKGKRTQMLLVILGVLLSLTGCLTAEEQLELDNFEAAATKYYQDKYGEEPQIESFGYYVMSDGLFPSRTKHKYARCADNTIIFYDADRDQMVDNIQSNEISTAIEKTLVSQMEQVTDLIPGSTLNIRNYDSSAYAADYEGNFYHTYYDGNIYSFLEAEDVRLYADLYLLCNKDDPWKEAQLKCEEIIRKYFRNDIAVTLTVLTPDCFEVSQDDGYIRTNIGQQGCFAEYSMYGETTKSYIQSFIKIVDGIYATCDEPGFQFIEGDIVAVEAISEDEMNEKIFARYDKLPDHAPENSNGTFQRDDKAHISYGIASSSTPIYNFVFSQRIKEAFPDGELAVYLRYIPEEVHAEEGDRMMCYEDDDSYRCRVCVPSNSKDAERETINEHNYYFIGSEEVKKPELAESSDAIS